MEIKPSFAIIMVFLIIFGVIYLVFSSKDRETPEGEQNVLKVFGEFFNDLFSDIISIFKPKGVEASGEDKKPLFPYCKFEKDFKCISYFADKPGKTLLFNFESRLSIPIMVYEVNVFGEIVCNSLEEKPLQPFGDFYVKLENCVFNGDHGDIEIKYYKLGSYKEFGKIAKATLILKD